MIIIMKISNLSSGGWIGFCKLSNSSRGGWMVYYFQIVKSILFFVNLISLNFYRIIQYTTALCIFIYIVFSLGSDRPQGLLFLSAHFTSFHTHTTLLTFFVCFSYFIQTVPMREYLGKDLCIPTLFPIAILHRTFFRQTGSFRLKSILSKLTIIISNHHPLLGWLGLWIFWISLHL